MLTRIDKRINRWISCRCTGWIGRILGSSSTIWQITMVPFSPTVRSIGRNRNQSQPSLGQRPKRQIRWNQSRTIHVVNVFYWNKIIDWWRQISKCFFFTHQVLFERRNWPSTDRGWNIEEASLRQNLERDRPVWRSGILQRNDWRQSRRRHSQEGRNHYETRFNGLQARISIYSRVIWRSIIYTAFKVNQCAAQLLTREFNAF